MSYWLHASAERELADAAQYYIRVVHKFLDEFEAVVMLLESNQQLGTAVATGLRIYPFRRFPYSIIYREASDGPRIFAVSHQKRAPRYWQKRL